MILPSTGGLPGKPNVLRSASVETYVVTSVEPTEGRRRQDHVDVSPTETVGI